MTTTYNGNMFYNKNRSILFNQTSYITTETYHALNRNSSDIYIIKSTSTLFYDLDTLAKRHSYHFVPEMPISGRKGAKQNIEMSHHKNAFGAKSETIVQECATNIKPKLKRLDSIKIAAKKIKKKRSLNDSRLSSEIFLRDNDYTKRKSDSYVKTKNNLRQKFWSYAKYQTQYTNPASESRKSRKDQGKRTEDPCPCQLFSYACPCTDKKSLTELAKNSKNLTVADQFTSTPNFLQEDHKHNRSKKSTCNSYCEDKPTNTNVTGFPTKYEMTAVYEEPEDKTQNISSSMKNGIKVENRSQKKPKQVICPNCREVLEITSTDDEDQSIKSKKSLNNYINHNPSPHENQDCKNNNDDDTDTCIHDPPCELMPVCQILPTDNIYNISNQNCIRRVSITKHNPKTIRITKACRHHPPCIVVPSCQRLTVLKNNCEFVPPCLHRPRCINVPLCVPISKNINYDDIIKGKIDSNHTEYAYYPPTKMTSAYQHKSLNYCNQTCEYVNECSPRFILSPQNMSGISPTFSPCQQRNQAPCHCCKFNKSCQYVCIDCKCPPQAEDKECTSNDDIIYIRDVGCQFKTENFAPKDSLLETKISSASFDLASTKAGLYSSKYHTLRYEDKCTNPVSGEEVSLSNFTDSSLEIDSHCPSHGVQSGRKQTTGFNPQSAASPFVAAFSTYKDPILQYRRISDEISRETSKSDSIDMLTYLTTFPVTSRGSFLKAKRKKVISIKRRKKTKRDKHCNEI